MLMTPQIIVRLLLTLAASVAAVYLYSSPVNNLFGWAFLLAAFLVWLPWRGLFLTWVYFSHRKKAGLNKNLSLLADIFPALMFYSHYQPPHRHLHEKTGNALRVLTLNAYEPSTKIGPKAEFIAAENADIVTVSEMNEHWELALKNLKHIYPYQKVTQAQDSTKKYHMLLLSKYPATVIKKGASGRIVQDVVQPPPRLVYLIQVHPLAPFTLKRAKQRNRSLAALKNTTTDLPLIIMGDFNCVPWHTNLRDVMTAKNIRLAGLPEPTYPSQQKLNHKKNLDLRPFSPLDYILIPEEATLLDHQIHKVPETDHMAVSACIVLPETEK